MEFVGDFHIHSRYARATSPAINLKNLDKWAGIKGIKVLGTGDFTHPLWFKELKEQLEPAEPGLFKLKNQNSDTRFILTSEISCIYSKNLPSQAGNKVRKIHILIFSPSFEICEKINANLGWVGNLKADGRPILGLDAKELLKIVLNISQDCLVIPAHVWTPWFSVFGSKSGFNSIEECFDQYSKYIFAIETGLSSDPLMNWRISALDKITLISNSDSHSLEKIGREANVFDTQISYFAIRDAIKDKDPKRFLYTIEFFPQEGKYHYDGHRICNISFSPRESKKNNNVCPKCKKLLTIGVLNRVEELADRPENFRPDNAIGFKNLIPMEEVIADSLGLSVGSKEVVKQYNNLISNLGSEFNILLKASKIDIEVSSLPGIAEGIIRVREGNIKVEPGYDGVYGKIKIFDKSKTIESSTQKSLF